MPIQVHVKSSTEAKFTVTINEDDTVLALKEAISKAVENTPADSQRVIFAGRVLKDEDAVSVYKICEGSTVHLVRSNAKAAASPSTPAASAVPASPVASTPAPAASTPDAAANPLAGNPFAALLGAGAGAGAAGGAAGNAFGGFPGAGFPGAGFPGGAGVPGAGMDAMMNNPQMAAAMSAMMSNPQFMDMMIASNPQLANMPPEMRQFMQSDAFRRIMADPNTMRQMMQMAPIMGGGMNPFAPANMAGGANPYAGAGAAPMNPTGAGSFDPALLQMLMGGGAGAGGLGGFGGQPLAPPPANPEEAYQVQLRQLQDMGFYDASENIRALTATRGNVEAAVEWLFANPPPGHR
ncbi:hypothetical protein HDU78_000846 [Chytriomyces hyalinus]|nr:hypothetical protein HDU78_000846 [Chytriomyces hyalinus]